MALIIPKRRSIAPSTVSQITPVDQSASIKAAGNRALLQGASDVGKAMVGIAEVQDKKAALLEKRRLQKIKEDNNTIATNAINEVTSEYTKYLTTLQTTKSSDSIGISKRNEIELDTLYKKSTKKLNPAQVDIFKQSFGKLATRGTRTVAIHESNQTHVFKNATFDVRKNDLAGESFNTPDAKSIQSDVEEATNLWREVNSLPKDTKNPQIDKEFYSQGVLGLIDQKRYKEAEQWLDTYKDQISTNIPKLRRNIKSARSETNSIDAHALGRSKQFIQNSAAETMNTGEINKSVATVLDDMRRGYGEKGVTAANESDNLINAAIEAHETIKTTKFLPEGQQLTIFEQKFGAATIEAGNIEKQRISAMAQTVISQNNKLRTKDPAGFVEQETNKYVNDNQVEWAGKVAPGEAWVNKSLELQAQFGATIKNGKAQILPKATMEIWKDTFKNGTSENKYELLQQVKQFGKYQGELTKQTNISPSYQYLADIPQPDALKIMDLIPQKRAEIEPLAEVRKENKNLLDDYVEDQNTYIGYLNTLSGRNPMYGEIRGDMAETFLKVLDFTNGDREAATEMMFGDVKIINEEDDNMIIQIDPSYDENEIVDGLSFTLDNLSTKTIMQLPGANELYQAERLRDIKETGVWVNRNQNTYELTNKQGFVVKDGQGNDIIVNADLMASMEFKKEVVLKEEAGARERLRKYGSKGGTLQQQFLKAQQR
ncbi:MAG: hypothetical protein GY710_06385 [Desulfobacteraceae bacterium]|nr:hypothetical protein [Desulfobacteraceae bacterium]